MASRILHLTVCSQLEKSLPITDANRFRIGQILPDALLHFNKAEFNTHFARLIENCSRKVMDFEEFYTRFEVQIKSDDMYLGYYFHLIEDAVFRIILYHDVGLIDKRGKPKFLEELYRDYHILNGRLVKRYGLTNNLSEPQDFKAEKINEIAPFEVDEFIRDMDADFHDNASGKAVHFTEYFAEKFIRDSLKICTDEFYAIENGKHAVTPYEFSWENKKTDCIIKK